jgi:molecular chaperone GrpE
LKSEGIEAIEAVGKEFDPNFHQAVMTDDNEEYGSNIVTEEYQKGYMIKDRVLRPAMVKVNQ